MAAGVRSSIPGRRFSIEGNNCEWLLEDVGRWRLKRRLQRRRGTDLTGGKCICIGVALLVGSVGDRSVEHLNYPVCLSCMYFILVLSSRDIVSTVITFSNFKPVIGRNVT